MFIVRSLPRTGTHLMRSSLCAHPALHCCDEIFHPLLYKDQLKAGVMPIIKQWITGPNVGFVVHDLLSTLPKQAAATYTRLWELMALWTPPLINLHRRDILRVTASNKIAACTTVWNQDTQTNFNNNPRDNPTCDLSVDYVQRIAGDHAHLLSRTQSLFTWGHTVFYEDLVTNYDEEMDKIQQYLKLAEVVPLQPSTRKLDTRPISEIISNYAALCDELRAVGMEDLIRIAEENDEQHSVPARGN